MKKSVFHFTQHNISVSKVAGAIGLGDRSVTVGELVFSDETSRNSFRLETSRELFKLLPQIEKNCDALLFRSEGRVFCSGGNLKDHVAQGAAKGKLANREIAKCLEKLNSLSISTIAVVEGDVFGGGIELLSAFDSVIAVPHAVFGFWQRRLGLSFGWGGGARLSRLVAHAELSRLALESKPVTAQDAQQVGLVDDLTSPWSARADGIAVALRMAALPKPPVKAIKRLKSVPAAESKREQQAFEKLWFGADHKARLKSFASKGAKPSR